METTTQTPNAPADTRPQAPGTLNEGTRFVRAIIDYLKEKGRTFVSFEKSTYENWNDIPFCNRFQDVIDTVSISDEFPGRICICVCTEGGAVYYDLFDGTETDEDFDYLWHEVYYYINDFDSPEAEQWLDNHEARQTANNLMDDLDAIAEAIAEEGGMNISYCASIDMTVFPSIVTLALPEEEYGAAVSSEQDRTDILEDLRFLAKNKNKIPEEYQTATLEEIRKYVLENLAEIFADIRKDANTDYYDYLGEDYRFTGIPDDQQPRYMDSAN